MSTTLTIVVLLKHLFSNLTLPEAKKEKRKKETQKGSCFMEESNAQSNRFVVNDS